MRKVFVVLFGLVLGMSMISCSEDSTNPIPRPSEFDIVTATLPVGWTCAPYNVELEATGGSAPYTWSLAVGSDPLPEGLSMTAEGDIVGLLEVAGEWTITVECTDDASTPHTDTQELTISVDVPANPSLGLYFDGDATVCNASTGMFDMLDCFVYIVLDAQSIDCCTATEFQIDLVDGDGNSLEIGTQYAVVNLEYPRNTIQMGDPWAGISIAYTSEQYEMYGPILAVSFDLMLMEEINELSFVFGPHPDTNENQPAIATCEQGYPKVEVTPRPAAVNY
jgi:hypothetical protein